MREANVCPSVPFGGVLLAGLGALLGTLGCSEEKKPGILIEVTVERVELRPDLVLFDWIAPGRPALVRGELAPRPRSGDESFFASLFVETRGPLDQPRVIALQGRLADGAVVSGGFAVIPTSIESYRSYAILLGPPLPDSDQNGAPDLVERCTRSEVDATCIEVPDAGLPPPDAPVLEDAAPPPPDAAPDAPLDSAPDAGAEAPDADPGDTRDGAAGPPG